jgi:hypothetical protein
MIEREQPDVRRFFLAFVEKNWRELSLRDASFLCPESFDAFVSASARNTDDT